jgi:hypothetical protein
MRKFVMAAALLAVAACGEKPAAKAADSTPPAMSKDTTKKDTTAMGGMAMDTTKKDTTAAPKKP